MIYEYFCKFCQRVIEKDFPFAKAKKTIKCSVCSKRCERHFSSFNFILVGDDWPGKIIKQENQKNT